MFTLLSTTTKTGIVNIPIFGRMTNGDMAQAILTRFLARYRPDMAKRTNEVQKYVKTLENDPQGLFIDPCYDVCPDAFLCSFGFVD